MKDGDTMNREGGYLIGRIHLLSNRLLNRLLQENNVTSFNSEQGKILYPLWKEDGVTVTELATRTGLALNTLSKMLQTMEQQMLIERRVTAEDKRSKRIFLAELGQQAKAESEKLSNIMTDCIYDGFSDEEIVQFEEQLKRLLNNLQQQEQ